MFARKAVIKPLFLWTEFPNDISLVTKSSIV